METKRVICKVCYNDVAYNSGDIHYIDGVPVIDCPYCMNTIKINENDKEV